MALYKCIYLLTYLLVPYGEKNSIFPFSNLRVCENVHVIFT